MGLIDFHAHLAPTEEAKARLLATMAANGIQAAALVAGGLVSPVDLSRQMARGEGQDVSAPNGHLVHLAEGAPLYPFYFANPHGDTNEYERLGHRYHGLKFGPAVHGVALADERNLRFVRLSAKHEHPLYLHCLPFPGFDVEALVSLAHAFPSVSFVLGHCGTGNCDFFAVDQIRPFANISFETSGGFASVVKYALETLGPNRIVFGSEYPLQDPAIEILKLKRLDLPEATLNRNARRLLRLEEAA